MILLQWHPNDTYLLALRVNYGRAYHLEREIKATHSMAKAHILPEAPAPRSINSCLNSTILIFVCFAKLHKEWRISNHLEITEMWCLSFSLSLIWLCVDAELAIGQYRLGVHGICGLNNPWHHLRKMSSWVWNSGRPPYVIPCGSAG